MYNMLINDLIPPEKNTQDVLHEINFKERHYDAIYMIRRIGG